MDHISVRQYSYHCHNIDFKVRINFPHFFHTNFLYCYLPPYFLRYFKIYEQFHLLLLASSSNGLYIPKTLLLEKLFWRVFRMFLKILCFHSLKVAFPLPLKEIPILVHITCCTLCNVILSVHRYINCTININILIFFTFFVSFGPRGIWTTNVSTMIYRSTSSVPSIISWRKGYSVQITLVTVTLRFAVIARPIIYTI